MSKQSVARALQMATVLMAFLAGMAMVGESWWLVVPCAVVGGIFTIFGNYLSYYAWRERFSGALPPQETAGAQPYPPRPAPAS